MVSNLYDSEIYFAITYDGNSYLILEPQGWDKIMQRIPADPKYFGVWSDFLEDKYGMKFTYIISDNNITGGAKILDYIHNTFGPNYLVYFDMGIKNSNTYQLINRWNINLNEYNGGTYDGGISTSIEKMPFQNKLRTRMSATNTVNDYANMDGELLTQISSWQLRLHSKTLEEKTVILSSQYKASAQLGIATQFQEDHYLVMQPDLEDHSSDELVKVFTQPVGLLDTGINNTASSGSYSSPDTAGLTGLPFTETINQYSPETNGILNVKWSASFSAYWQRTVYVAWQVTPRLVVQRSINGTNTIVSVTSGTSFVLSEGGAGFPTPTFSTEVPALHLNDADMQYILPSITSAVARSNDVALNYDISFDETFSNISILVGDNVYLQLVWCPYFGTSWLGTYLQIDKLTNSVVFDQLTSLPGSTADAYRPFDMLNQGLESITGQKNALISSFFSEGGFGYKYMLTNGYSIRNFNANIYQPKIPFDRLLNSLQSIFGLGAGIRKINDIEYLVVEEMSFFFRNNVIPISTTKTYQWKNLSSSKYSYNKATLGFSKYEGLNLVQQDEFCTQSEYLFQFLQLHNNQFNSLSDIVGSGYLIEEQRRNQFTANPGQSLTNDNDIFIVATAEPNFFKSMVGVTSFSQNDVINNATIFSPIIQFRILMFLQAGDIIQVAYGGSLGTMQFTVVKEAQYYPNFPALPSDPKDAYVVANKGNWVSGTTYSRQDIVYDTSVSAFYLCYSTIIGSSVPPNLDGLHFALWNAIGGDYDVTIIPPSPNQVFAERNQPFEICENVIDPSTIYNGRLSVKHIRANWRPLFGIGLYFVNTSSPDYSVTKIVTTEAKMNSLFTTKYISTEPNKGNVGDMTLTEIARDFVKDYTSVGKNLFSPLAAQCIMLLGYNDMDLIRKARAGELGDDTIDYGGINVEDDNGILWFCHILDIKYDLVKQSAELTLQKVKQVPY